MLGRVNIINEGILNSGVPIRISLENNSMFGIQNKTLVGLHADYEVNKDFEKRFKVSPNLYSCLYCSW